MIAQQVFLGEEMCLVSPRHCEAVSRAVPKQSASSEIASLPPVARNDKHEYWMKLALELAERGRGRTSPNPIVGTCVVKGGRLISKGFHARFGEAHAEVDALRKAGRQAKDATLYVTLEPCSTYGKTPPCVDAIIEAKVRRVVIATRDPNPKHRGRGIRLLRKAGIRVDTGILRHDAERQNESFLKWIRTGLPFVTVKIAQSLDGKIASRTGESRWISGSKARLWVHELRASQDAILVGKNTVLADDPRLSVRNGKLRKEPWRIVLDAGGTCSPRARIFRRGGPTILACSDKWIRPIWKKFRRTRATLIPLKSHGSRLDLKELLGRLGSLGITSLLVEGGGEVAWSFFEARLVDKVNWILAPKIIGGRDAKTSVEGLGVKSLTQAIPIRPTTFVQLGKDWLLEGYAR